MLGIIPPPGIDFRLEEGVTPMLQARFELTVEYEVVSDDSLGSPADRIKEELEAGLTLVAQEPSRQTGVTLSSFVLTPSRDIAFTRVRSTNIDSVAYLSESCELLVKFKSGSVYRYCDVPYVVYGELLQAPSIGSYFSRYIREAYSFERVS